MKIDWSGWKLSEAIIFFAAALLPLGFIIRFLTLTLYSIPETDDFCLAEKYFSSGLLQTLVTHYINQTGRLAPVVVITAPAMLSTWTGIDLFVFYPLVLLALAILFVASTIWMAHRLWPEASRAQLLFIGCAMAAVLLAEPPSLRDMLYWLPGFRAGYLSDFLA